MTISAASSSGEKNLRCRRCGKLLARLKVPAAQANVGDTLVEVKCRANRCRELNVYRMDGSPVRRWIRPHGVVVAVATRDLEPRERHDRLEGQQQRTPKEA